MLYRVVFSRRTAYAAFLLLMLLSIAYRYPLVDHERNQSDSYFIHSLASDILADGAASWTFHPLSYFGLYPLSYPSGIPFLCSELSCITGLSIEGSFLLMGIVFGIVFCAAAFCLIRHFVSQMNYALLGTFLCVCGSRAIDSTYWVGSGRAPVAILMIVALLAIIMASSKKKAALYLVGISFMIISFTIHHMAILILLFGFAYLIVTIGRFISSFELGNGRKLLLGYYAAVTFSVVYVGFVILDFFYIVAEMNLGKTSLFDVQPSILSVVLNAGAVFTRQIGPIMILTIIGAPFVALAGFEAPRKRERMLSVFCLLVFIPLIGYSIYITVLLAPLIAAIGVIWIKEMCDMRRVRKAMKPVIVLLIVSSLVFPVWTIREWNSASYRGGDEVEVSSQIFNDAEYLNHLNWQGNLTSNVNSLQALLSPISGIPFIGGGVNAILYGEINQSDMAENIVNSGIGFPRNLYVWYEYSGPIVGEYFRRNLMIHGVEYFFTSRSIANDYLSDNSRLVVAIDNNLDGLFVTSFETIDSVFAIELKNSKLAGAATLQDANNAFESYRIYSSQRTSLYVVQLPI